MLKERAQSKKLLKLNLNVFEPEQVPLCTCKQLSGSNNSILSETTTEFSKLSVDTFAVLEKSGLSQVKVMSGIRVKLADSEGDISDGDASTDLLIDKLGKDIVL